MGITTYLSHFDLLLLLLYGLKERRGGVSQKLLLWLLLRLQLSVLLGGDSTRYTLLGGS